MRRKEVALEGVVTRDDWDRRAGREDVAKAGDEELRHGVAEVMASAA